MLVALLTMYLLGGGLLGGAMVTPDDIDVISERVELIVIDPARTETAMQVLDELKTGIEEFDEMFIDSGDTLRDVYLEHTAGATEMLQAFEALNLKSGGSQQDALGLREQLKATITAEEWVRIFEGLES